MKKHLKRFLLLLLALILVLGSGAVLARDWIARVAMEKRMLETTGFRMEIGSLDSGLFSGAVSMRGVTISNPPAFTDPEFMRIPDFSLSCDPLSLFRGKPHINEMTMHLGNVIVVRLPDGDSNLKQFRAAGSTSQQDFFVDKLNLQIGKIIFRTYGRDGKVSDEKTIEVNATKTHKALRGSSAITWAVLKTILFHGEILDAMPAPEPRRPGLEKAMELLRGFARPGSRVSESMPLPHSQ